MIEKVPGRLHGRGGVIAMIALVAVFDGYDVFVPSYVIHYVQGPWRLSPAQSGALVSSGLLGFMIGALLNGFIADRIGRRPTLLAALWIAGLGSLATALLAQGLLSFAATRIISGIGLGMIMPTITAYLNEFMPGRFSNVATTVASSGYTVGGVIAGLVGILLTPSFGWTVLFYIGGLGCIVAMVMQGILPESPMFVRRRPESPRLLLARDYRRDTIVLWLGAGLALFNIYALSTWIPTVMIARGSGFSLGFFYGSLLQLAGLIGGLACAALSDRFGSRRRSLALWYALLALSVTGLGVTTLPVLNLVFAAAAGFFLIGAQPVFNNLAAQSYPTELRATGVGMALGIGRIGAIAGPLVIGAVQSVSSDDTTLFLILAAAACATSVVLLASTDRAIVAGAPGALAAHTTAYQTATPGAGLPPSTSLIEATGRKIGADR